MNSIVSEVEKNDYFLENIEAFKIYVPNIYQEIIKCNVSPKMIRTKSGEINVFDEKSESWLYGDSPKSESIKQAEQLFENPHYSKLSFSELDDHGITDFIHTKFMEDMYKIYTEATKSLKPIAHVPNDINSVIFFGIGSGYHIEYFFQNKNADHICIIEPKIEWFIASLHAPMAKILV